MELLRFLTAGSVDDGKSTLIGRLLYDSKAVSGDILEAIERSTKNKADGPDLSLLTDGLRAEREQGITIDVAYKYFSTEKRKFIIADAPGHVQYTRNMVTAASTADLIIILIDARNGVVEQTRRHTLIAAMLGIKEVVFAVNKIDLVDYDQKVFESIETSAKQLARHLGIVGVSVIPVSAKEGDNIVYRSQHINWYQGPALLELLEDIQPEEAKSNVNALQVQYVVRPMTDEHHDYRGFAGSVLSGKFVLGDVITVLPSGLKTGVKSISIGDQQLAKAVAGQAVTIELNDDIDISRGDTLVAGIQEPVLSSEFAANICWMDTKPLVAGTKWLLQHNSKRVKVVVKRIDYQLDIISGAQLKETSLPLNGLGKVFIKTSEPLAITGYQLNRKLGAAVLIDETSNATVGAITLDGE